MALGGRFDGRVAGCGAGTRPFGPAGRAPAGFWRVRGCADHRQEGGEGTMHAIRGERLRRQATLPGQAAGSSGSAA